MSVIALRTKFVLLDQAKCKASSEYFFFLLVSWRRDSTSARVIASYYTERVFWIAVLALSTSAPPLSLISEGAHFFFVLCGGCFPPDSWLCIFPLYKIFFCLFLCSTACESLFCVPLESQVQLAKNKNKKSAWHNSDFPPSQGTLCRLLLVAVLHLCICSV